MAAILLWFRIQSEDVSIVICFSFYFPFIFLYYLKRVGEPEYWYYLEAQVKPEPVYVAFEGPGLFQFVLRT
jgi:hypothetical protein